MDCRTTEQQRVLRRAVRESAETEIRPHVREWGAAQAFPRSLTTKMAAVGLMGIQFPEQYGGVPTPRASAMAKLMASEAAVRASEECVQIHGRCGFVEDYPAERSFRDVKLTTIRDGPSQIQRLVIARQLLARHA